MSKTRPTKVRPAWRRAGFTSARGCPGGGAWGRPASANQPCLGRAGRPYPASAVTRSTDAARRRSCMVKGGEFGSFGGGSLEHSRHCPDRYALRRHRCRAGALLRGHFGHAAAREVRRRGELGRQGLRRFRRLSLERLVALERLLGGGLPGVGVGAGGSEGGQCAARVQAVLTAVRCRQRCRCRARACARLRVQQLGGQTGEIGGRRLGERVAIDEADAPYPRPWLARGRESGPAEGVAVRVGEHEGSYAMLRQEGGMHVRMHGKRIEVVPPQIIDVRGLGVVDQVPDDERARLTAEFRRVTPCELRHDAHRRPAVTCDVPAHCPGLSEVCLHRAVRGQMLSVQRRGKHLPAHIRAAPTGVLGY
eukprot:scaffold61598_cov63-Phaeocystis_antarctica.AAC.4